MPVAEEHGVVVFGDSALEFEPSVAHEIKRLVHENEPPADIGVLLELSRRPVQLLFRQRLARRIIFVRLHRVKTDEQAVLVFEAVVGICTAVFVPQPDRSRPPFGRAVEARPDVVVAHHMEKRHLQSGDVPFKFVPLLSQILFRNPAAGDEIADRHNEFRAQQIQRVHRFREIPFTLASGTVGDHGETEFLRIVEKVLVRPRFDAGKRMFESSRERGARNRGGAQQTYGCFFHIHQRI